MNENDGRCNGRSPRERYPWFPFYARDWLLDDAVVGMTAMACGCYIRLLAYEWENGSLPADPALLAQFAGLSDRDMYAIAALEAFQRDPESIARYGGIEVFGHAHTFTEEVWPQIEAVFPIDDDGQRRNPRLESLRQKAEGSHELRSLAGKKGARRRWQRDGNANGNAMAEPMAMDADADADADEEKATWSGDHARVSKSQPSSKYPEAFERFWRAYPKNRSGRKPGKRETLAAWRKLSAADHEPIVTAATNYGAEAGEFVKNPVRFVRGDFWRDFVDPSGAEEAEERREDERARGRLVGKLEKHRGRTAAGLQIADGGVYDGSDGFKLWNAVSTEQLEAMAGELSGKEVAK